MAKQDSIDLSLPQSREVRGCMIKRMPLGTYLVALQTLKNWPAETAAKLLPDGDLNGMLERLKHIDRPMLVELLMHAFAVLPEQLLALVAQLTGIPVKKLHTDPAIGLDGLAEIVDAWLEVNGAENFLRAASRAMHTVQQIAASLKPGSSR